MLSRFLLFFVLLISFLSCKTPENVVYFQNSKNLEKVSTTTSFISVFKIGDIISILVLAADMDAARPFNLMQGASLNVPLAEGATSTASNNNLAEPSYLIDEDGNIDFPVLGTLKVAGLTRVEIKEMIKEKLKIYINDPVVSVRLKNFKFTVIGEVLNPGSYTIPNERVTIIEALGMAGDMTITGKRDNIMVIRENEGINTYYRIDITSKTVFDSPVYYLAQNDVLYIEPNTARVKSSNGRGNSAGIILGALGVIVSAINLFIR